MMRLLRLKHWWLIVGLTFLLVFAGHLYLYRSFKTFVVRQTFQELRSKVELAETFLKYWNPTPSSDLQKLAREIKQRVGTRVSFIAADGTVIADSDAPDVSKLENHLNRPEIQQALKQGSGFSSRYSATMQHRMFYVAVATEHFPGFKGFLRLSYYSDRIDDLLSAVKSILTGSFFVFFLLLTILETAVLAGMSKPWQELADQVAKLPDEWTPDTPEVRLPSHPQTHILTQRIHHLIQQLQKQAQTIETLEASIQSALDAIEDPIAIVNPQGRFLAFNAAFLRRFGEGDRDLRDRTILEVVRWPEITQALQANQFPVQVEFDLIRPRSREINRCRIERLTFRGCEARLLHFADVTQLRRLEAIRRDFVANISHELKTPLTSIIGYVETMLRQPGLPDEKRREFLQRIGYQSRRMENLVMDLLKLSELEQGAPIEVKPISLNQSLREVVQDYALKAESRSLKLELNLPEKEIMVLADLKRLREALENLIQNAIQYTPEGGKIQIFTEPVNGKRVKVLIRDTGIGIDPKFHERIFQRFYRVDSARKMHESGTGLGLAITRHIIEAHGQEIGVESQPGKGSTFYFTLQLADTGKEDQTEHTASATH